MPKRKIVTEVETRGQRLRKNLLKQRQETIEKIQGGLKSSLSGEGKTYGGDEADVAAAINIDNQRVNSLTSMRRQILFFDRAIGHLDAGTYGVCEECGEDIAEGRLEAYPLAIRCIECQQVYEESKNLAFAGVE